MRSGCRLLLQKKHVGFTSKATSSFTPESLYNGKQSNRNSHRAVLINFQAYLYFEVLNSTSTNNWITLKRGVYVLNCSNDRIFFSSFIFSSFGTSLDFLEAISRLTVKFIVSKKTSFIYKYLPDWRKINGIVLIFKVNNLKDFFSLMRWKLTSCELEIKTNERAERTHKLWTI